MHVIINNNQYYHNNITIIVNICFSSSLSLFNYQLIHNYYNQFSIVKKNIEYIYYFKPKLINYIKSMHTSNLMYITYSNIVLKKR